MVLYDNGAKNKQVQDLEYKKRVTAWRHGRGRINSYEHTEPPRMTLEEAREYRRILFVGYCQDLDELPDA